MVTIIRTPRMLQLSLSKIGRTCQKSKLEAANSNSLTAAGNALNAKTIISKGEKNAIAARK